MNTVHRLKDLRQAIQNARRAGQRIGFVPTMGNLHAGHLSLVQEACLQADFVVASIFVNPLQFSANEDLDKYPRTLQADSELLQNHGCHLLFTPNVEDMYPQRQTEQTLVSVPGISEGLCGTSRPGHFTGVATVVAKLFNMVQPDLAVFGQKDYQQLAVIRRLVRDLNFPIEIIGAPIVRAADGLALSSRNGYLSVDERQRAPALYQALKRVAHALQRGDTLEAACQPALVLLQEQGLRLDYLEIRDALTLQPATPATQHLCILGAVFLGCTRLIDNIEITLPSK